MNIINTKPISGLKETTEGLPPGHTFTPIERLHMISQHSNSLATATAAILVQTENLLRLCTKMAAVSMAKGCMQMLYSHRDLGCNRPKINDSWINDSLNVASGQKTDGPKSAEYLLQQIRTAFLCRAAEAPTLYCVFSTTVIREVYLLQVVVWT